MKLYEIKNEINLIISRVEENQGEISEEAIEELRKLNLDFRTKCINTRNILYNFKAEEKALREEEARLRGLRLTKEKQIKRLEKYLFDNLKEAGINEIKDPIKDIAIKKNPPKVVIDDASKLSPDYYVRKEDIRVDRIKLKYSLTNCPEDFQGIAHLEREESLSY